MSLEVVAYKVPAPFLLVSSPEVLTVSRSIESYPFSDRKLRIEQFVYLLADRAKSAAVINILIKQPVIANVIVYVKTNFAADQLAETLNRAGIAAESFHENKSQRTQIRSLSNFRSKSTSVLVATESAASSVCIAEVSTMINFDLPVSADTYVERIKNHSRPENSSIKVFSLCNKCDEGALANINRVVENNVKVLEDTAD